MLCTALHLSRRAAVGAVLAAGLFQSSSAQAHFAPIAPTGKGLVRGTATDSMSVFRGIPYAAPPTGDLRWRPPEPARR